MDEWFDLYDINRNNLGRKGKRKEYIFNEGEYHIVTDIFIFNSMDQLLVTKRAANKIGGLLWETPGGSLLSGENSKHAIIREVKEEIGIDINIEKLDLFKTIRRDEIVSPRFKDFWIIKTDIDINDLELQEEEVIDAKWIDINEFNKMKEDGEFIKTLDFDEVDFKKAISLLKD